MTPRAIVALGIGQCVNWGVLYYAFGVLVLPLEAELGTTRWVVTGAFSIALLMSALMAPTVGAWSDAGHGPVIMQVGGFAAAALLATSTFLWNTPMLYVVWAGLGLCMAATLYEPAFALIARTHHDPIGRLRSMAAITIFGGLASTVFLPLTGVLVALFGWRTAVDVLAFALAASTYATRVLTFRGVSLVDHQSTPQRESPAVHNAASDTPQFGFVLTVFSIASLASAAFTANIVPALSERQIPATTAAILGGFLGLMQLPGRALLMSGALAGSPARLLGVSTVLQAVGLAGIAVASSVSFTGAAIMVFAIGAGLTTLVRPHLVQTMFSVAHAGRLNGRVARQQQLARAAGPIGVAWLAGLTGYAPVFLVLACVFVVITCASLGLDPRPSVRA